VFNWFKKKDTEPTGIPVVIDMHSHLLPGLDDGVTSFEESEMIIRQFQELGYSKLITTPHIISDTYRNTPDLILGKLKELNEYLAARQVNIIVQAAAEYYLDEVLFKKVENNEPLLTLGSRYVLFEMNFLTEPFQLKDFIFLLGVKGYRPLLAHPERYLFLQQDMDKVEDLYNRGVLLQVNTVSLTGYYSKSAQHLAQKLIDKGWVHFLGSDCHSMHHMDLLKQVRNNRYFHKALELPLLNNTL
jgi:tyrosine-protein phosphatase YwqE